MLLELGDGRSILEHLLDTLESAGVGPNLVTVGFDHQAIRKRLRNRARTIHNPFFEHHGVCSSLMLARDEFFAAGCVITVGDHYLEPEEMTAFLKAQPEAPILLHCELKKCDDEDMKVFIDQSHQLCGISKTWRSGGGNAIGEFSGMVRLSPTGSRMFFECLAEAVWNRGCPQDLFMADVLMACHQREPLGFHLSTAHRRLDIDFPSDYERARELYAEFDARRREELLRHAEAEVARLAEEAAAMVERANSGPDSSPDLTVDEEEPTSELALPMAA